MPILSSEPLSVKDERLWCLWAQEPLAPCIHGVYSVWMARVLTHNISFRVPAAEMGKLQALRATFADQQWGVAMRWLFAQPEVQELISKRAHGEQPEAGPVGIENSIPRGDR